jgi:hypothetical protein
MMAPTLVVLVRLLLLMLRYRRQDVYWMVADITLGKTFGKNFDKSLEESWVTPDQQMWIGKRIGTWSSPEGREYRVESQAIRQAPDHHPRLQ